MPTLAEPKSLLEVGDAYIQATWAHPQSNTDIIAIYIDVTPDNNKTDFVMDQPIRGPWSVHDPATNSTLTDMAIAPVAYQACASAAMKLFQDLNQLGLPTVKQEWADSGGIVYDL